MDLLPNITIVYMWLIFIASYLVLSNLIIKPTLPILAERKKRLAGQAHDAHDLQKKAQAKLAEYEKVITAARQKAREERELIIKSAEEETKKIVSQARGEAGMLLNKARQDIIDQTQVARDAIGPMSQQLARQMVDKLLGKVA